MSHVNTTPHYGLPIYGENDIINPLTDFNDANSAIDTALYEIADAQGSEASAITDINTFLGDKELETVAQNVTDAVNEVNTAVGNADTAIGNVAGDVVTLQGAVGDANTGLIHDVSSLQTTVGSQGNSITAIQLDVGALQGSMVTAKSDINDIKLALQNLDGADVDYSGTTSGLSATNVQSAIDEVVDKVAANDLVAGYSLTSNNHTSYNSAYTLPSDGYIQIYAGGGAGNAYIYGASSTADSDAHVNNVNSTDGTRASMFVKKGMKVYATATGTSNVSFVGIN